MCRVAGVLATINNPSLLTLQQLVDLSRILVKLTMRNPLELQLFSD